MAAAEAKDLLTARPNKREGINVEEEGLVSGTSVESYFCCGRRRASEFTKAKPLVYKSSWLFHCKSRTRIRDSTALAFNCDWAEEDRKDATDRCSSSPSGRPRKTQEYVHTLRRLAQTGALSSAYTWGGAAQLPWLFKGSLSEYASYT